MVVFGPLRFAHHAKKTNITRGTPRYRDREREKVMKKSRTPADKAAKDRIQEKKKEKTLAIAEARAEVMRQARVLHERFGDHSVVYYYRTILQQTYVPKPEREVTTWNAFVAKRSEILNEAVPEGQPRLKANETAPDIKRLWDGMSPVEREEYARDKKEELEKQREAKKYGQQNVSINMFHDARATIMHVQNTLENLHHRTGTECVLIATRDSHDDFLHPYVLSTSARIDDFFQATTRDTLANIALKMEAFCLTGLDGVARSYQQEMLDLKREASTLVLDKLRQTALPRPVPRMYYQNFDQHITKNYGIVLLGWPLAAGLRSPSELSSRVELKVLIRAFESGTARFKSLSEADFEAWLVSHAEAAESQEVPASSTDQVPEAAPQTDQAPGIDNMPPSTPTVEAATVTPSMALTDPTAPASPPLGIMALVPSPAAPGPSASTFVFSITDTVAQTKKPRKTRSDKGTKRGANARSKAKTGAAVNSTPSA